MSSVFGSDRYPAYSVIRTDKVGNPISLGNVLPESQAILFTGPPGMGKTSELYRAEDLAEANGWSTIRINASANAPLEHQLTIAIRSSIDELRKRFSRRAVRKLDNTVGQLTRSGGNKRLGVELRFGGGPFPMEYVGKMERDTTAYSELGTTLTDFADELGKLTGDNGRPILLLVDGIDQALENDQAGLNELAIHIEQMDLPVWLVAAGGARSTWSLMNASRRMSGIATTISNQFDVRELGPLPDDQVWKALTLPLQDHGIAYEHDAIDRLVASANGDPSRLRSLSQAAIAYQDQQAGITVSSVQAAIAHVNADAAETYQDHWNQKSTTHAQKDLLVLVASQGPNSVYMPAVTQAAGPGKWQEIDQARQQLVARGMLREHGGGVVTIPDEGFRDWVNDYVGQTPDPVPELTNGPAVSRGDVALAPVHPTSDRELVNQVFGISGQLVHEVKRTDAQGRPISLEDRGPTGTSLLFTGAPGSGTSHELTRTKEMADAEGWIAIQLDASRREGLEARFIRAVQGEMDAIKKQYPAGEVRELKQLLNRMAVRTANLMKTNQLRFGLAPGPKVGIHKSTVEGIKKDSVGTTLNEVAEHLGKMAHPSRTPILVMVDNLDAASKEDLYVLTSLSAHLKEVRHPMFLIAAGGEEATSRLLEASGGHAGTETKEAGKFDVRRLQPIHSDELRRALTVPLDKARVRYEPEAVDNLVAAANGNPTRLRTLAAAALELTDHGQGITADVAATATARLNAQSRALYDAAWYNCSPNEKELLAKTSVQGSSGMVIPSRSEPAGPGRWDLDEASHKLISRGLLTRTGYQIRVADPGFQDWVQTRLGFAAAQSGIARPQVVAGQVESGSNAPRPALGQGGPRREDVQVNRQF
ncbi:hypothetical protein OG809_12005 [Kribbella soli]